MFDDHYKDSIRLLSTGCSLEGFNTKQNKKLVVKATNFQLILGQLYKIWPHEILYCCDLEHERLMVLNEEHASVAQGHYVWKTTLHKILQAG